MFAAARFFTAVIVIWTASLQWPNYSYYIALRAIVFAVAAIGVFIAFKSKDKAWIWAFGLIAVLYNPIPGLVIHLSKPIWLPINLVTGMALLISLDGNVFAVGGREKHPATETKTL